jgi:hypothetical protein
MKESRLRSILEALASRSVSTKTDLWPEIEARLNQDNPAMPLRTKWSWSLALVILALALLTSVAYALYRYFSDPGLRSAGEAGLITDVNTTSEPSLLTPAPQFASGSGEALTVGETRTQDGIRLTLDWLYVEDARQALHMTVSGLGPEMRLGVPSITFSGTMPSDYTGATLSLQGDQALQGTYLVHQMLRPDGQPGGRVDVHVEIPVYASSKNRLRPLTVFEFDVPSVDITVPWGGGGGGGYALEVNGLEMRLEHVILAPSYTEARLCFEDPAPGGWSVENATLQFSDLRMQPLTPPVKLARSWRIEQEGQQPCEGLEFRAGAPGGDVTVTVTAHGLMLPRTSQKIDSTWSLTTYVSTDLNIAGIDPADAPPAAPLGSQTVGDITATLQWAYFDSNRMAFTVNFENWDEDNTLVDAALVLTDGKPLNVGMGYGPEQDDPSTFLVSMTPAQEFKQDRFQGQLILKVSTSRAAGAPLIEFAFDLDLPVQPALTLQPNQAQTAGGVRMILQTVKLTPSYTVVYLCYPKPAPGDWMTGDPVTLKIGEDEASISDYAMMYDSDYGDVGKGLEPGWKPALEVGRCVRAGFPVGHHNRAETLTLTIDNLQLSTPELIPEDQVKQAIDRLRLEGIEMDWMTATGSGGGGAGPSFKKLPAGINELEAYRRFLDALGSIHRGPWIFTVNLEP